MAVVMRLMPFLSFSHSDCKCFDTTFSLKKVVGDLEMEKDAFHFDSFMFSTENT